MKYILNGKRKHRDYTFLASDDNGSDSELAQKPKPLEKPKTPFIRFVQEKIEKLQENY